MKGFHTDRDDVSEEMMYWYFAHHFGYTPDQVDSLPYDRMNYFVEMQNELEKLEKHGKKI